MMGKRYKVEVICDGKVLKSNKTHSYEYTLQPNSKFSLRFWNNNFKYSSAFIKIGSDFPLGKKELAIPPRSHAELNEFDFGTNPLLIRVDFWEADPKSTKMAFGGFVFLYDPYDPVDKKFGFQRRGLWKDSYPDKEISIRLLPEK